MIEEGNKKKLKKQKSKKKNKREIVENSDTIKVNEIPAKFKNVFEEVGLKIEEFLIYPV